ncbi:hypothetical protein C9374_012490 [Naegleria lovaniensis]|uniref:Uncharacterized protein n=1 Tax=Naegleria lovaniensis TaxID=51637 RepID=A0AA88GWC9_NAELO|nr:uncharacterized protein C9374_012490 [Naegleria lovaniensis]KAG2392238.1 hypothetical protein C9374_012490 [Naegleria lovaniensis]
MSQQTSSSSTRKQSPPPESVKRTQILYPVYIDKNKSLSEGRRIPKEKCVENPKASEIVDICEYLKIPYEYEPTKRHPQEPFEFGRVRVLLKKDHVPQLQWKTKQDLLIHIASLIPNLQTRMASKEETSSSTTGAASSSASTTTTSTATKSAGGSKQKSKGGKKKK